VSESTQAPTPTTEQREWLAAKFEALPTELSLRTPSEWAEAKRILPQAVTPLAGPYRFEVVPYLREIADCMGVDSPIREVAAMKGGQIGATTGLAENILGYFIDEVKTAPVMWVTAQDDMAKTRMDVNILPMIHYSGIEHLIQSSDLTNKRRTGITAKKLEWLGGGCLLPLGAQNPNKFRQQPAQVLLCDEIDGWPLRTKSDGDPIKLIRFRTAAYEEIRKILWLSTPSIKGQSKIEELYLRGDQRQYFVRCLECGHAQTLRWERINPETGEKTGMVWEMENGRLVPGTVRYLCEACAHPHANEDKTKLLSPDYGAEWRPTAAPVHPDMASYHIPSLLSPDGMQSWEAQALQYLDGWDIEKNKARDLDQLQVFYNNVIASSFKMLGQRVKLASVTGHRRDYKLGEVPNRWAQDNCGGPSLLLTCAVDVHKDDLAVAVFAWARGSRGMLVDYWRFKGDTEQLSDEGTWRRLRTLLLKKRYAADDGKVYPICLTLIDSGYRTEQVYSFCTEFSRNVYPLKGREGTPKNAPDREFSQFKTPLGRVAFSVNVDFYKGRWASALRRPWDGITQQYEWSFNAPSDATDEQLRELTREERRPRVNAQTKNREGWTWHRPSGSANELWDLLVYNNAALDIVAYLLCIDHLELKTVSWPAFWDLVASRKLYFTG